MWQLKFLQLTGKNKRRKRIGAAVKRKTVGSFEFLDKLPKLLLISSIQM